VALHHDTQRVQRDGLNFIERTFDSTARGFQAESALFCRQDPSPFPNYFGDAVTNQLAGPTNRARAEALIGEFRSRPVTFIIKHRLFRFPDAIEQFWSTHYGLYRDEVMIPGRNVAADLGQSVLFEVIVPGRYRWITDGTMSASLAVDQNLVENGAVFHVDAGIHTLTLPDDAASGRLDGRGLWGTRKDILNWL
jgi:hypothetical protein